MRVTMTKNNKEVPRNVIKKRFASVKCYDDLMNIFEEMTLTFNLDVNDYYKLRKKSNKSNKLAKK